MSRLTPKPHYIIIHGAGDQSRDHTESVLFSLPRKVRSRSHVFRWDCLLNAEQDEPLLPHVASLVSLFPTPLDVVATPLAYRALTRLSEGLGDMLGDVLHYERVRDRACRALDNMIEELIAKGVITPGTPIVLIGHSLGSMVALYYCAWLKEFKQDVPPYRNIERVITVGTPIDRRPIYTDFKESMLGLRGFDDIDWVNYWGTRDWVCSWIPWRGKLHRWKPNRQVKLIRCGHKLEDYLKRIHLTDFY